MPSVRDTPVPRDHDAHDCQDKQPQEYPAHPGFWYRLGQYVRQHRVPMPSRTQSSARRGRCRRESSMARLAQEQPTLFLRGLLGIHNS